MADRGMYPAGSNVPFEKDINFKFFVDAGNPPTLAASPLNNFISSVARVAQGQYRITLADPYLKHVNTAADLNVNASGVQRWAQSGPVANFGQAASAGLPTVDIFIVDNTNTAQDPPAANANNFVSGTIVCCDIAAQ
jgi:hypothetical protein